MDMSFLKKLGLILVNVATTAAGIGPILAPLLGNKAGAVAGAVGVVANDLTAIGTVVVQIETALHGKAGADKLAAAVALVGPIIRTSQLVTGKKIADEALLQKGIAEVTQGVVDILNSIDQNAIKTEIVNT
jgi:hypothetical protein